MREGFVSLAVVNTSFVFLYMLPYLCEIQVESRPNSLHCNSPAHGLQIPPEINLMEVKLPASVLVEDNGNVEKAEAYTKELEDVSNLLFHL